jgi:RNA-directed DNA polymerase
MITQKIAASIGLSVDYVLKLSNGASHRYKSYPVLKKNGGVRIIHHPSRRLKSVQNWILQNVLVSLPVHEAALAYRPGISILDNAALHAPSRFLLRLDLEEFFPSIVADDFVRYVRKHPALFDGWTDEDIRCVSRLLFRTGRLTIGAPSSPAISNALCMEMDVAIAEMSRVKKIRYSRYADDLFFSSGAPNVLKDVPTEVEAILRAVEIPANLRLNLSKTVHSSKKRNRQVTGINLGSDGKPHVPRAYKRLIRSMIHRFAVLDERQKVSLAGMISYVVGHEPGFTNSLIKKYGFEVFQSVTALKSLAERQEIHKRHRKK